ncbi:hypothetical protein PsorP6_009090 [Peronosclerospora sorghi]|uniref:Uncharacterized protein n=1 Tax=Peronosclerospora sorghi TaxID=230839 RepID=A0ACC0W1D5_9STRA|nr:hypothetical protein PsorP6_009090 [Peronosclerospora sorghi]
MEGVFGVMKLDLKVYKNDQRLGGYWIRRDAWCFVKVTPFFVQFAGLYDHWKNDKDELTCTYTILTTAVAPEIKWLHTRMPLEVCIFKVKNAPSRSTSNVLSFFGVKPEKQQQPFKTENETISDTSTSDFVKKENDELPQKNVKQFPANFVPASSIVDERSNEETQNVNSPKTSSKRRRISFPTETTEVTSSTKLGPKQSSLDFYFGQKHRK